MCGGLGSVRACSLAAGAVSDIPRVQVGLTAMRMNENLQQTGEEVTGSLE